MKYAKAIGKQIAAPPQAKRRDMPPEPDFTTPIDIVDASMSGSSDRKLFLVLSIAVKPDMLFPFERAELVWLQMFSDTDATWDQIMEIARKHAGPEALLVGFDDDGIVKAADIPNDFRRDETRLESLLDRTFERASLSFDRFRSDRQPQTVRDPAKPVPQRSGDVARRKAEDEAIVAEIRDVLRRHGVEADAVGEHVRRALEPDDEAASNTGVKRIMRRREDLPDPNKPASAEVNVQHKQLKYRTFQPVIDAVKEAASAAGETQNAFLNRAVIKRLRAEFPDVYQRLKDREDEFPPLMSHARPGIDLD